MFSLYSWSVQSCMWINDWVPQLLKNPLFPHRTNLAWYSEWEYSLCKEPLQLQNFPRQYLSWRSRDKLNQGHQIQLQGSASHMTTGYCICTAKQNAVLWLWSGSEALNSDKSQNFVWKRIIPLPQPWGTTGLTDIFMPAQLWTGLLCSWKCHMGTFSNYMVQKITG